MKFGNTLEQGLVPEWRDKYVDYKMLKKLLKVLGQKIEHSGDETDVELQMEANALFLPDAEVDENSASKSGEAGLHDRHADTTPTNPEATPSAGARNPSSLPTANGEGQPAALNGGDAEHLEEHHPPEFNQHTRTIEKLRRRFSRFSSMIVAPALVADGDAEATADAHGFQELLREMRVTEGAGAEIDKLFFYHLDKQVRE
eukprot:CAMPEP_0118955842 /NCGR_PEP_ID=MMETSP1169-20130426/60602_1 /TAXON_ID=36882 /ORGANISM="Pyramimonas obovata, Strain CCMP722" /LENGTH=200 /DNA_ID=CAMNT_0006903757 /DNA_START=270 /DNA_END=869 /DNA_ORIENTATION=+